MEFADLEALGRDLRAQLHGLAPPSGPITTNDEQPCRHLAGCNRTARLYADLCDQHAVEVYCCEVRPSTIAGAGMGLFATKGFDEGDCIDLFEGTRIPLRDARQQVLPYGFGLKEHDCAIDAASTQSCLARYINHSSDAANCAFVRFCPRPGVIMVSVLTLRAIKEGEELLLNYGGEWRGKM